MSIDQLSPRRAPRRSGDATLIEYEQYIDTQIQATRRLVKVVDFATGLVLLATAVLVFLLTAAIVEHWLVPGGFPVAGRTALFAVLVGGTGWFAYRRIWPLCLRAINPVYAAQTIERSSPSLKNTLINLLLFRQHRADISDAVYQTLEEQAAQRLTRVPVDAAVDRTLLIRLGYVLLAVVAVAALYKVFSPKDPLIAVERVLMPWADIVPASRVTIAAIQPGTLTVSRGEFIDVSAEVRGIGENDPVLLRYTTDDDEAVDKAIPMRPNDSGLRFEARLPENGDAAGALGVAQNLTYRIEAGDARSLDYAVTVVPAPAILVARVEYDYPAYTGYVDRHVDGGASRVVLDPGHIRAIEGTRVTVHARANGPIDEAFVDFDADGRRDLHMTANGTDARASFVLALREDRQTPEHASYALRFTNVEGRPNRDPVKHPIDVQPDLEPETAILMPQEKALDVRLDETLAIEVEARDPDFALAEVRLRGEVAGRPVFDEPLLAGEHTGRFTARYQFTPSAHDLRAGDVVQYLVAANDNRAPKPNSATSERKQLRITSPDPAQPPPDRIAQRDQRQQPGQQQPGEQHGEGQPQAGQSEGAGNQDGQGGQQQPGAADRQPQPGENQGESASADGQSGQRGGPGSKDNESQPFSRDAQAPDGEPASAGGNQPGEPASAGGKNAPDTGSQPSQPGQPNSDDKQTGAGAAGGDSSQQGSQPDGARPDQGPGSQSNDGKPQAGGERGDPNTQQAPISSDGDNDAEAFDRIQKHLERSGEFSRDDEQIAAGEPASADGVEDDPAGARDQTKSPDGQETSSKGPSGAGDEQQSQGAPRSQPDMKPAEKWQQSPSTGEQSDDTEPPTGARGRRESDSQGEQGGDKAGGGEDGGGQEAPRDGTGSAGQNQSADEGAGESSEQGTGNTSPNAGQDSTADDHTGQPDGETPGRGSKQRDGQGNEPGSEQPFSRDAQRTDGELSRDAEHQRSGAGDDEQRANGKPASTDGKAKPDGESATADGKQGKNQDAKQDNSQGGTATGGGGQPRASSGRPPRVDGATPEGDAANLEYARKQTDLVLEKLAEQLNRKQVDPKMLEQLGWTEEDLRRFIGRWQQRKEAAGRKDPAGETSRRELDDALRSLGLRRGPLQQSTAKDDTQRDLREGYRGPVPLEYQERLRAYNQGVSRARQDGE